jgi:hypothetical protein
MKPLALLPVAALLLVSCGDSSPTAPPAMAAGPPTLSLLGSAGDGALDFSTDLNDLKERALPGFPDQGAAERLSIQFDELHAALTAGNAEEASRALALAREIAQPGITNWGDLGNINMVLDMIDRALAQR